MDATKAIANSDGCDQRNYRETPKRSWEKPLKCNEEGRGNQPRSHKVALSTNATRASWGRCEYHNDTLTATMNIAVRTSIVAKHAQWTQTAMFCWPAQESRVIHSPQDDNYPHHQYGQRKQQQQKNEAVMTRMPRVMRATIARQAANWVAWQSRWHRLQWRKNKCKQR